MGYLPSVIEVTLQDVDKIDWSSYLSQNKTRQTENNAQYSWVVSCMQSEHIDVLVQDCSYSGVLAMELALELQQSCTKPSIWKLTIR